MVGICYNESMYLCVDIGGTKTLASLFSKRGYKIYTKRFLTNARQEVFWQDLKKCVRHLKFVKGVAVAVPGVVRGDGKVKYGNLEQWNKDSDFDLKRALEEEFPEVPVKIVNDADAATLYEARYWADKKVVYLTFSTGIGGGIAENGQLTKESARFEPGHKKYTLLGRKQEWEDLAAASAIRKIYGAPVTTLKDQAIFDDVAVRISLGCADIIEIYQPDVMIFGGPLARQLPRFARPLRRLLAEALSPEIEIPRLLRARRPNESVIYGLCALIQREEPQQ